MVQVADVYSRVCYRILEPAGLQLGLVTIQQFEAYLTDAVNDFLRLTGLSKVFATQTINYGIGQYTTPDRQLGCEEVFVQGRFIPRSSQESIDNSHYQWKRKVGVAKVWHEDGLPINTVELVFAPNWQGAQYVSSDTPAIQYIDAATSGNYSGIVRTGVPSGSSVEWQSGQKFLADATLPGKTIVIAGVLFTIASVIAPTLLTITTANLPVATNLPYSITFPVTIPASDRNLTTYGSQIPTATTYSLTDSIPFLPDAAGLYLAWSVLARIYADDSELKDSSKCRYATSRWQEGINVFRAAVLESMEDADCE